MTNLFRRTRICFKKYFRLIFNKNRYNKFKSKPKPEYDGDGPILEYYDQH